MLIGMEGNWFRKEAVYSVLPEKSEAAAPAGEFEHRPCARVSFDNGQSFVVHKAPEEVIKEIEAWVSTEAPDAASGNSAAYTEALIKQFVELNKSLSYLAEMCSRLTMCMTDGNLQITLHAPR